MSMPSPLGQCHQLNGRQLKTHNVAVDEMYRSFAPLRMTPPRIVVILSEAKDLYEMLGTTSQQKMILKLMTFPSGEGGPEGVG